jgi:iron complex transport system substrate-binding protein
MRLIAGLLLIGASLLVQAVQLPTIVSTNLCSDLLSLSLAAPEQIVSLSVKSRDPARSSVVRQAKHYPVNHGSSEEIIALRPDLVLASRRWRSHPQLKRFRELGIQVVIVPPAVKWQDIIEMTLKVAQTIGREAQGRALVADLQQRLSQLQQRSRPLNVLYLRVNGRTAGDNTYIDTVLKSIGVTNHASSIGVTGWGQLSLEQLVIQPPDAFLVSDFVRDRSYAKSHWSRHPWLQQQLAKTPILTLPANQGSCTTWQLIELAESLALQIDQKLDREKVTTEKML